MLGPQPSIHVWHVRCARCMQALSSSHCLWNILAHRFTTWTKRAQHELSYQFSFQKGETVYRKLCVHNCRQVPLFRSSMSVCCVARSTPTAVGKSGRVITLLSSLPGGAALKGARLGVVAGVAASSKLPFACLQPCKVEHLNTSACS